MTSVVPLPRPVRPSADPGRVPRAAARLIRHPAAPRLALGVLLVVALALRWQFVQVQSGDYRAFLAPWYEHLASTGFAGLADSFSNYNTPYLVLLALVTHLPIPQLIAIKAISVLFDLALAVLAHRIVSRLRPGAPWAAVGVTAVVALLPTVVLNSSAWGQCDAIYATFCLGSLYALLPGGRTGRPRPWLAAALFGVAFAFKLQAVFFLPVLVAVLLVNRLPLRSLLAVPAAFLAMLTPALVAGRSLASQLAVYPAQITTSSGAGVGGGRMGRGGAGFGGVSTSNSSFTYNAPTPYAWLPADASQVWKDAGLVLTALVLAAVGYWLLTRRRRLDGPQILLLAAASTALVPFLLPDMHERYFYVAEVALVLAGAVDRRMWAAAAALQAASITTYAAYLTGTTYVPLGLATVMALGAVLIAGWVCVERLRASGPVPDPVTEPAVPLAGYAVSEQAVSEQAVSEQAVSEQSEPDTGRRADRVLPEASEPARSPATGPAARDTPQPSVAPEGPLATTR